MFIPPKKVGFFGDQLTRTYVLLYNFFGMLMRAALQVLPFHLRRNSLSDVQSLRERIASEIEASDVLKRLASYLRHGDLHITFADGKIALIVYGLKIKPVGAKSDGREN